ncbi:hypothetical protein SFSGTM_17990 [Sulfuriferula nivalis]|uniref:Uncharacterized protein n=1 Tax=Sulfuriferula nivalis TaxID=2675298 RepID=A0A809RQG9_9PROT|nr:hypothetical protein SFSGTM_17990 [Sulfuriferula nivalis]
MVQGKKKLSLLASIDYKSAHAVIGQLVVDIVVGHGVGALKKRYCVSDTLYDNSNNPKFATVTKLYATSTSIPLCT